MKIGILTGGGDVPPLNGIIFSAQKASKKRDIQLIGFNNGWEGLIKKDFIILNSIKDFSSMGGTFLKSSRVNLQSEPGGVDKANSVLSELQLDGLIIIGGDDTLSNSYFIESVPCILISKTIDNDIGYIPSYKLFKLEKIVNYFTLGYPTAVEKIISFVKPDTGIRTTAYSHQRIMILESMGMHSGWLSLAAGIGNPDFIIIPEYPLNYNDFIEKLIKKYNKQKHIIIVIAEGARLKDGSYLKADHNEQDDFNHPRFGGVSYCLRDNLKNDLKKYFNTRNINAVNPSYIYRSGVPNNLDMSISQEMGKEAITMFMNNKVKETILLFTRYDNELDRFIIDFTPLSTFKMNANCRFPKRSVPDFFYNNDDYRITNEGIKYFSKITNLIRKSNNKKYQEYYGLH